jgi:hypothetical protein
VLPGSFGLHLVTMMAPESEVIALIRLSPCNPFASGRPTIKSGNFAACEFPYVSVRYLSVPYTKVFRTKVFQGWLFIFQGNGEASPRLDGDGYRRGLFK